MGVVFQLLLKVWGYGFPVSFFSFPFLLAGFRSTQWESSEAGGVYITRSFHVSPSLALFL